MGTEVQEAKTWVYNLLKDDVTLQGLLGGLPVRVYVDRASRELGFPYVVINHMGSIDRRGVGKNRMLSRTDLQVKVVSEGVPSENAINASKRVDELLEDQVKVAFGGYYFTPHRIAEIDMPEYDQSQNRFQNLGGIYRVWISKTP